MIYTAYVTPTPKKLRVLINGIEKSFYVDSATYMADIRNHIEQTVGVDATSFDLIVYQGKKPEE